MLRESQAPDDDRVFNEEYAVVAWDGNQLLDVIAEAKDQIDRSQAFLTRWLAPITLFDDPEESRDPVEIRQGTKLIDTSTGDHLRAESFDIAKSDDVECGYERSVTFRLGDTVGAYEAARRVTYYEADLQDALDEGPLVTDEELHESVMSSLQEATHVQ